MWVIRTRGRTAALLFGLALAVLLLVSVAGAIAPTPFGCQTAQFPAPTGAVFDAVNSNPNVPIATSFSFSVPEPAGQALLGASLSLGLQEPQDSDLKITLTDPASHTATLTANRVDSGGNVANPNVPSRNGDDLDGVLWDDTADVFADAAPSDVLTSPLVPEDPFGSAFAGDAANGTWKLSFIDNRYDGSGGQLNSGTLTLLTCTAPLSLRTDTASGPATAQSIPTPGTLDSQATVSSPNCYTGPPTLHTNITGPNPVDIDLISPTGRTVDVARAAGGDDLGAKTWGLAQAGQDQSLARFAGQDPNGAWTLVLTDHQAATPAQLVHWDLSFPTLPCGQADVGESFSHPAAVTVGQSRAVTLTISNAGPQPATHVVSSVQVPASLHVTAATVGGGTCRLSSPVVCTIPTLAAGSHEQLSLTIRPIAAGSFGLSATTAATQADPTVTNNSARTTLTATPPKPRPKLTRLKINPSRFRAGGGLAHLARSHKRKPKSAPIGTTISFTLSATARVTLSFSLLGKNHSRHAIRWTLTLSAHAKTNRVRFAGRINGKHKIARGSYALTARARNAGGSSRPASAGFTIVRG